MFKNYINSFLKANTSTKAFRLLIILFWTRFTMFKYVEVVFSKLPVIWVISSYIFYIVLAILLVFSWNIIKNKIKLKDFLFVMSIICVFLISYLIFENNSEYIQKDFSRILIECIPLYFVGILYSHNHSKDDLFCFSVLSIVIEFSYQIYYISSGREVSADNMDAAYKILPSILFVFYYAVNHINFVKLIIAIMGAILIFLFGTRGPFLITVVTLFVLLILKSIKKRKNKFGVILGYSVCLIFILVFLNCFLFDQILLWFKELFENIGFSTRIFEHFLEDKIADDNGRNEIFSIISNSILEKPWGYGLCGDRTVSNGRYAHNLFLELWCQFGIVLGSFIIISLFVIPIQSLKLEKKNEIFNFLLIMVLMVFIKLMISGSYLHETWLFFVIGLSINSFRKNKMVKKNENC